MTSLGLSQIPALARICGAILAFNIPCHEGHLEPEIHFYSQLFLNIRENVTSNGVSVYKCFLVYSTSKCSLAPRILAIPSE